ncbi:hypothetical protein HZB02_00310 [Candidatus Woesearchaeota archaeon]|nr:hypothetical protein [Candidatus Woesearchaeota archaeon]
MILEKYFGRTIEDRVIDFETAVSTIEDLREHEALPITYRLEMSVATHVRKYPDYDYVLETLQSRLAPYQIESNPALKGETSVRHIIRDFPSKQTHTFYFKQTIDNLYEKGLSGCKAKLKLKLEKRNE